MGADPSRRIRREAFVALVLVQIIFGAFPILGKIALREVTPMVIAFLRVAFGALFLTLAEKMFDPDAAPHEPRDRRMLALLSFLGILANQTLFISGLARTTATNATLLVSTVPVFTLLVGVVGRVERAPLSRILGIPVALGGVLLLLDLAHASFSDRTLQGDLMIAANSLSYSIYLVASRPLLKRRSAVGVTAAIFRYAALPMAVLAIPDLRRFHPGRLSGGVILALAGIVIFATAAAYFLNSWALARTDASTTAVFIYLQPLITGALAWVALGERPAPQTLMAATLIFGGVALATLHSRTALPSVE